MRRSSAALERAAEIALRPSTADPRWTPSLDDREDLARTAGGGIRDQERSVVRAAVEPTPTHWKRTPSPIEAVATDPASHRRSHLFGLT